MFKYRNYEQVLRVRFFASYIVGVGSIFFSTGIEIKPVHCVATARTRDLYPTALQNNAIRT